MGVSIFHVIMFSYSMGLEIYVCGVFHVSFLDECSGFASKLF